MSHSFPAPLLTKIQSGGHKEARLVKLTMADGTIIGMTDWDISLAANIDGLGSVSYSKVKLGSLSAFASQINAPIDDTEMVVLDEGSSFTADMIRGNRFDGAGVKIAIVDPDDLANPGLHRVYDIGQVKVNGSAIHFELLGKEKRLEQNIGVVLTVGCRFHFGSTECGIDTNIAAWLATHAYVLGDEVKPTAANAIGWFRLTVAGTSAGTEPTWPGSGTVVDGTVTWTYFNARRLTGTVSGVTDKRIFTASGISIANDHFGEGLLTWLTGNSAGQSRRMRSDNGSGTIGLHIPMLKTIQIGDTFTAIVGCRHRFTEDCITKHGQPASSSSLTVRFGGFPHLAPEDITMTAGKE